MSLAVPPRDFYQTLSRRTFAIKPGRTKAAKFAAYDGVKLNRSSGRYERQ